MGKKRKHKLKGRARRHLKRLLKTEPRTAQQIMDAIERLESNPFESGAEKMSGPDDRWKLRVGIHLRVIFTIKDDEICITYVGQRENAPY